MSKPSYKRSVRVADQMQHEIADIIFRKIKDPRIGFVTVTAVEVSSDLRNAKVFVSQFGGDKEETLRGLSSASRFIRSELGRRMRLKFVPELIFRIDDSAEKSAHVMEVLRSIKVEGKGAGEDDRS